MNDFVINTGTGGIQLEFLFATKQTRRGSELLSFSWLCFSCRRCSDERLQVIYWSYMCRNGTTCFYAGIRQSTVAYGRCDCPVISSGCPTSSCITS